MHRGIQRFHRPEAQAVLLIVVKFHLDRLNNKIDDFVDTNKDLKLKAEEAKRD